MKKMEILSRNTMAFLKKNLSWILQDGLIFKLNMKLRKESLGIKWKYMNSFSSYVQNELKMEKILKKLKNSLT